MILASTSSVGLLLGIAAALAYAVPAVAAGTLGDLAARRVLLLAWALHGLLLAWTLFGGEPRFGFAPALSITRRTNTLLPTTVGVPLRSPVTGSSARPAGSAPSAIENV